MAEKPRLKETDEILYSVAKKRRKQPAILPTDILPPPTRPAANERPAASKATRSEKKPAAKTASSAQEGPAGDAEDRNPLDFGKYELPKKAKKAKAQPVAEDFEEEDFAAPTLVELVGADEPKAPVAQSASSRARQYAEPQPQAEPKTPPIRKATPIRKAEPEPPPRKPILSSPEAELADVKVFEFEDWGEQERSVQVKQEAKEAAMQAAEATREARAKAKAEMEQRRMEATKAAEEHRDAEARRKMLEDDRYRENALKQLSTQFEEEFSQQFERKKEKKAKEKPSWVSEKGQKVELPLVLETGDEEPTPSPAMRSPAKPKRRTAQAANKAPALEAKPAQPPRAKTAPPPPAPAFVPDDEAEQGADEFFQMFEQEVKEEEEVRTQDFKETLAEKFMRERERYLEELGIAEQMEAAQAEEETLRRMEAEPMAIEPPRRRLNLQIQPEMHLQDGELPPPRQAPITPVTYSRNAAVEPQKPVEETENGTVFLTGPDPDLFRVAMEPAAEEAAAPSKKTTEQMLLELGEQTKRRAVEKPLKAKENASASAQFNFRFTSIGDPTEEEDAEKKPKRKRRELTAHGKTMARIIALSATASLLVLSLLYWGVSSVLNARDIVQADGDGVSTVAGGAQDTLEIYQSYTATNQTPVENVMIKRTGVTLGNLTVAGNIVVEELATVEGPITLSNIIVDDVIYVKSSGNNELNLQDVRANRIVINNDQKSVTIRATGNTEVNTVEVRTGAVIEQGELTGDAVGIQNVIVKNGNANDTLTLGITGARIQSVSTQGQTIANFEAAMVETMTADGNLTLNGSGKVQALSAGLGAGQGAGQGAGDLIEANPLSILIKGVEIGHLNIKSPANINVSANVDSMAVSNPINIGGNGMIANLVFNESFGNSRLAVDISGVSIQQLTTNAESLIYSGGSSTINTLIANESTYALGNKVNTLVTNAAGVIYENEPDFKRTAQGVAQPQSKADNPNLNYSLGSTSTSAAVEEQSDPEAGSCAHDKDAGGFREGDGSKNNPFVVESPAMLAHVSQHPGSHFIQSQDIDIANNSSFAGGFPMIAAEGTRFSGSYDGKGYAIKNLNILAEQEYVGLFAENTGVIQNVRIDSGDVSGGSRSFIGAVVGFNYQGGQVVSCSNGASVQAGDSAYAGGVVGYNYGGKVRDCYNTARVTGGDYAGGVVGMNRQNATVTGSYNVGLIEASGTYGAIAGGNEEAVITNCFFLERSSDEDLTGSGSGGGNAVGIDAEELSSAQMAATLAAGNDDSLWQQSADTGYPYPVHKRPSGSSAPAATAVVTPSQDESSGEESPEEETSDEESSEYSEEE